VNQAEEAILDAVVAVLDAATAEAPAEKVH